ncbi:hypothetical protein HDU79_000876 [Rhizoclosmatium sp. JEL0117]|nr:hypothetical protein HDU79_000876 [Rhizoclosmatium sp. JEL0117]
MEVTPLLPHQSPAHPLALQDPLKHKICLKRTSLIGISLLLLLIIIFESSKFAITFRFPAKLANEAASLKSIRFSYEGVGTVKVIAVRGKDMKYTMLEAEYITTDWTRLFGTTMDALVDQADPTSIRFIAKFPPLNTLFSPRITVTIYVYLPLELENLSIQGEDIDVIYMGPNVSKTLSVKVQRGTIQILTPISLVNVALSTTKGTLRIENANATTFELAAFDLSSSVSVTGQIGCFKSAVITTKSASVNMFLYPDVSASVKMKSIKGSYKLGTYGFKGNVSFSSQRHAGLFDGIDWPLLGIFPTRATVGGKDGRGVMSIETQQGIGQFIFAKFL